MKSSRTLDAADLFCGAGGITSGLEDACQELGIKLDVVAVNHWEMAIKVHGANHPNAHHYCASIDQLDPRKTTDRLDVLVAAPECIFHSKARGGRPINDQRRA
ncbi:MAG: DNA cytosine methyltransferase, partial [Chloroflexi bacterium]|nr:DNA cytosine methyltransferase [Chloroflexota bacterium]